MIIIVKNFNKVLNYKIIIWKKYNEIDIFLLWKSSMHANLKNNKKRLKSRDDILINLIKMWILLNKKMKTVELEMVKCSIGNAWWRKGKSWKYFIS